MTREEILKLLSYNPKTGDLYWKVNRSSRAIKGSKAGTTIIDSKNLKYVRIIINGKKYLAHRLAFLIMEKRWPKYIDHINGEGTDNRWENLREATCQENNRNKRLQDNNTSGATGVIFNKKASKWMVSIKVDSKRIHLGYYEDFNDAVSRRKSAEVEYGFHENHGRIL